MILSMNPPYDISPTILKLISAIAEQLGDRLDTKVSISLGKKKGQLVIDFATIADLNRILKELGQDIKY